MKRTRCVHFVTTQKAPPLMWDSYCIAHLLLQPLYRACEEGNEDVRMPARFVKGQAFKKCAGI